MKRLYARFVLWLIRPALVARATEELPQIVRLKVPDGFRPSTAGGSAAEVLPMKPPRVAFPFEEIR